MPLISMFELMPAYKRAGKGIGAFNVPQLDFGVAYVQGAEELGKAVILQVTENNIIHYRGGETSRCSLGGSC
jgi:fructose-bisphosphate aldolase class II